MSNPAGAPDRLPSQAKEAMWQIFGNGESPFNSKTSYELTAVIVRNHVKEPDESQRAIAEIQSWFEQVSEKYVLKQEMRNPVARQIIAGVRCALASPSKIKNHETAFWAMGSIRKDVSAPIVRSSWSCKEIDKFVSYSLQTLEILHQQGRVIDPKDIVGPKTAGVKAYPSQTEQNEILRNFQVGLDAKYQAYRLTYSGIASVVDLLLELKPEALPELVHKVQNPLLQSFAAHCVADASSTSDYRQPLQWITKTAPTKLVALAILHTMENVREIEMASSTTAKSGTAETPDLETMSDLISDLVSRLVSLDPSDSTWWIFELLNYTSHGPSEKRPAVEQVGQCCTRLLKDIVLDDWSRDVVNELKSGLRRAQFDPRGKPLADIAWEIRDGEPQRAAKISRILLGEHEHRMTDAVKYAVASNMRFPYLGGNWNHQDWITALAMGVVICHKDIDPMDWAIEKCKALPLNAWDADEEWQVFHLADRVAQTQMTIGLYAIQLLEDVGRSLDCGKLQNFAERVWGHTDFVRQYSDVPVEDSGTAAEFAARVAAAFGEPDQAWALKQANNPAVDPRSLRALLDQMKRQGNTAIHEDALAEIRQIADHRYINAKEANQRMALHLTNLWVLLDAPEQAAKTAKVLLTYHPAYTKESNRYPLINRELVIPALKMLAFAESRGKLAGDMVKTSRSLYDNLWGSHTPPNEKEAREDVDTWLNQTSPDGNTHQERE